MGHGLRGAMTAALTLIALQVAVTKSGSGRIGAFLTDTATFVNRAFNPNVAAIPDHRTAGGASPYGAAVTPTTPYTPPPLAGPYLPAPTGAGGAFQARPI